MVFLHEISKEYLLDKLLKNRASINKENAFCESVCDELSNIIFNLEDDIKKETDKDEAEELREHIEECEKLLKKAKKSSNVNDSLALYQSNPFFDWRDDEPIIVLYDEIVSSQKEMDRLKELVDSYLSIIKEIPPDCELEICFSRKSPSIYLKTDISAVEENVEDFLNLGSPIRFSSENVYNEDECYSENLKIEIRLSDHDFGGFTKFQGYGDYVSYRKPCVNYVYKF